MFTWSLGVLIGKSSSSLFTSQTLFVHTHIFLHIILYL